MTLKKKLN